MNKMKMQKKWWRYCDDLGQVPVMKSAGLSITFHILTRNHYFLASDNWLRPTPKNVHRKSLCSYYLPLLQTILGRFFKSCGSFSSSCSSTSLSSVFTATKAWWSSFSKLMVMTTEVNRDSGGDEEDKSEDLQRLFQPRILVPFLHRFQYSTHDKYLSM